MAARADAGTAREDGHPPRSRKTRFHISPRRYSLIALIALITLTVIVTTGAAVRLTASGLGCPDWPKCYDQYVAPAQINAMIEYGNRLVTGVVSVAVIAACGLVFFRRPYRWHLAVIAILLPLGVIAQAILGAFVVYYDLNPALVIFHFIISMILLDAAFALWWCSRHEPGERRFSPDWAGVWAVRALIPFGQLTVLLGTITTASGPHPGDHDRELVHRFTFKGAETLQWIVERHAAMGIIFALAILSVWLFLGRRGGDRRARKVLLVCLGMALGQIALGLVQWQLQLPAILVWFHVVLATLLWLGILWAVATAGQIEPARRRIVSWV